MSKYCDMRDDFLETLHIPQRLHRLLHAGQSLNGMVCRYWFKGMGKLAWPGAVEPQDFLFRELETSISASDNPKWEPADVHVVLMSLPPEESV